MLIGATPSLRHHQSQGQETSSHFIPHDILPDSIRQRLAVVDLRLCKTLNVFSVCSAKQRFPHERGISRHW